MGKPNLGSNSSSVLADLLTRYVGRGKTVSVEAVADACGCHINAVYMAQKGTVGMDLGMAMLRCLPDEAVTEFFAFLGWSGVRRIEAGSGDLHEVHYELTRTGGFYGEAYRDGLLDHREQRKLLREYLPRLKSAVARCLAARVGA